MKIEINKHLARPGCPAEDHYMYRRAKMADRMWNEYRSRPDADADTARELRARINRNLREWSEKGLGRSIGKLLLALDRLKRASGEPASYDA